MQQFERAELEVQQYVEDQHYGKFEFGPLEEDLELQLVMQYVCIISCMPGGAVYSIKIDEFTMNLQLFQESLKTLLLSS